MQEIEWLSQLTDKFRVKMGWERLSLNNLNVHWQAFVFMINKTHRFLWDSPCKRLFYALKNDLFVTLVGKDGRFIILILFR